MKRLFIGLIVLLMLAMPMLIPNVQVNVTNGTVEVSKGGEAQAWNLLQEMCHMLLDDDACDHYFHDQGEGWW